MTPSTSLNHVPDEAVLIKVSGLAKMLSVSRSEAYELAHRHFKPIRFGKALRVRRETVMAWLDAQQESA